MDIKQISKILEEFSRDFTLGKVDRDSFADFLIYNDIGLPLAQCIVYDLASPTEEGEKLVLETWNNFCNLMYIDPDEEYDSLDDIFDSEDGD